MGLVLYASIAVVILLDRERTAAWSKRHSLLNGLLGVSLLFLTLAVITGLSTPLCAVIAAVESGPLVGLSAVLRRRRGSPA